jgi:hypothetical protein
MAEPEFSPRGWALVDTQAQLQALDESVCWEESEPVALLGDTSVGHASLPADVSRSGYINWNLRVLFFVRHALGSHLEIFCIDCDEFSAAHLRDFTLLGRVDSLKRVDVSDENGRRLLRCSRLMYRFVELDHQVAATYYGLAPAPFEQELFRGE